MQCFLLLLCTLQMNAENLNAHDVYITLSESSVSVRQLIQAIEKQSDFLFLFRNNDVNLERVIRLKTINGKLSDILAEAFPETMDLRYEFQNKYIVLSKTSGDTLSVAAEPQQARKTTVTGIVKDVTGEPLAGANIIEKGVINGTTTDADGNFTLTVANDAILQISFIGYRTQEIKVDSQSTFNVTLAED
ncbi:MAG: carboxypeptidase-like regulatory domain-containing protein, partial [Tannerella sp.]|nr:carboxypeptidase-like regulatory domain-containing protein [Tannerella sp.]